MLINVQNIDIIIKWQCTTYISKSLCDGKTSIYGFLNTDNRGRISSPSCLQFVISKHSTSTRGNTKGLSIYYVSSYNKAGRVSWNAYKRLPTGHTFQFRYEMWGIICAWRSYDACTNWACPVYCSSWPGLVGELGYWLTTGLQGQILQQYLF